MRENIIQDSNIEIGQGHTLQAIIKEYRPFIEMMAKRMARTGVQVDELVSEAFFGLVEEAFKGLPIKNVKVWILSISRTRMLAFFRKQTRLEPFIDHHTNPEGSLEDLYLQGELMAMLQSLLSELPERDQQVVLERVLDGRDFTEIAKEIEKLSPSSESTGQIGLSREAVRQVFRKAMRRLKNKILPLLRSSYGSEEDPYDLRGRLLALILRPHRLDPNDARRWLSANID